MSVGTKKNALDLFSGMNEIKKEVEKTEEKSATESVNEVYEEKPREVKEQKTAKFVLPKKTQKSMKSRSLYMDDAIYEKLQRLADKNGLSVSEALSEILTQVL